MIYQYKCNKCGHTLEVERAMTEEERSPTCMDCHNTMSRVWTSPSISFKGAGFYSNDKSK